LRDVGKALRFDPPLGGKDTIVVPVAFEPRNGKESRTTQNGAYTAHAYVTLEAMRDEFHACEDRARRDGKDVSAWGVYDMDIDSRGAITSTNIDPFVGDQELLGCAAEAMQQHLQLAPPDGGTGKLMARITFNPRAGTR
jgi:hypothetical protein